MKRIVLYMYDVYWTNDFRIFWSVVEKFFLKLNFYFGGRERPIMYKLI